MKKYHCILIFLLLGHCTMAQLNVVQEDSLIRASRAKTNELIANHDVSGMARYWLSDYVRISGNGNLLIGRDSSIAFWNRIFRQQPTIYYVRTPAEIKISEDGLTAWESGIWMGMNTKSKGGNYAATWVKTDNIWKLQSELFTTLSYY